jgi:hypothetical protein
LLSRIRTLLCALSLLVFAMVIVLSVRSYFAWERVVFTTTHSDHARWSGFTDSSITWSRGNIDFSRFRVEYKGGETASKHFNYLRETPARRINYSARPGDRANFRFAGFQLLHSVTGNEVSATVISSVGMPLWIFLPCALPPLIWWRRRRLRRATGFAVKTVAATEPS